VDFKHYWAVLRQHHLNRIIVKNDLSKGAKPLSLPLSYTHQLNWELVNATLNTSSFAKELNRAGWETLTLKTQAQSKAELLGKPHLGRELDTDSIASLLAKSSIAVEMVIVIADGMNARAVQNTSGPFLKFFNKMLLLKDIPLPQVLLVANGSKTVGAEIGKILKASFVLTLIGDRPKQLAEDSISAIFYSASGNEMVAMKEITGIKQVTHQMQAAVNELAASYFSAKDKKQD